MMTKLRLTIANLLRSVANRLDPYHPASMYFASANDDARTMRGGGPGRPKER